MSHYLASDADILHDEALKNAIVKIIGTNESTMNTSEQMAVSGIVKQSFQSEANATTVSAVASPMSNYSAALRRAGWWRILEID